MILSSRCSDYLVLLQLFPRSNTRRSSSARDKRAGTVGTAKSVIVVCLPGRLRVLDARSDATRTPSEHGGGVYAARLSRVLGPGNC